MNQPKENPKTNMKSAITSPHIQKIKPLPSKGSAGGPCRPAGDTR